MAEAYKCDRCGKLYESEDGMSKRTLTISKLVRYCRLPLDKQTND